MLGIKIDIRRLNTMNIMLLLALVLQISNILKMVRNDIYKNMFDLIFKIGSIAPELLKNWYSNNPR